MVAVFGCFTMQSVLWPNAPIIGGWAVFFNSRKYIFYRISDVTGAMETEKLKEGDLSKDDLDGEDAFLISAGPLGIWVWLGRHATKEERQCAMQLGEKFIKEKELPRGTALTRTFQCGEPDEFKTLFVEGTEW